MYNMINFCTILLNFNERNDACQVPVLCVRGAVRPFGLNWLIAHCNVISFNLLNPVGYVIHHQFNIQQQYALPTLYLCVLYLSENKQRLVPLTAQTNWFFITEMKSVYSAVRTGSLNKAVCASSLKG